MKIAMILHGLLFELNLELLSAVGLFRTSIDVLPIILFSDHSSIHTYIAYGYVHSADPQSMDYLDGLPKWTILNYLNFEKKKRY